MRNTSITVICILTVIQILGCNIMDEPIEINLAGGDKPEVSEKQNEAIEQRFNESDEQSPGAVESALMWSEKYDELSVRTEALMEKNTVLVKENSEFKHKLSKLQMELDQTKKELDEANTFLQEMQLELNTWKSDVLGFRDEMRKAENAQLQALSRILKILGAEMTEPKQE